VAQVAAGLRVQRSARSRRLRVLSHNRNLPIGLAVLIMVATVGAFAPLIAPHDPLAQDLIGRLQPPIWDGGTPRYIMGSDGLGRDVLSRMIYGARISLLVGISVPVLAGALGAVLGLAAGYFGGWADILIMRLADAQQALPGILLAIMVTATFGASVTNVVLVLSVASWPIFARILYSATRSLKEREFVAAAVVIGARPRRILSHHILPNVAATWLVIAALQTGRTILAEASLSFLGLGVPPPAPSWGGMVSDGLGLLRIAPWMTTFPGLAILITVLGINLLGDGLRQALDPKLRQFGS
jgi:peptide/nickel transport system permease protein